MPVQLVERLVRVHAAVHADEGAAARRDQLDLLHRAELAEQIGQLVLGHQLREVANPERRRTNCKKGKVNKAGKNSFVFINEEI